MQFLVVADYTVLLQENIALRRTGLLRGSASNTGEKNYRKGDSKESKRCLL